MTREAALKAWETMRAPVWKAKRTATKSQQALAAWAEEYGFRVAFLDATSGNPRTGIVDALLFRIKPKSADQLELYVVQLKGGGAGIKADEMTRLSKAAKSISAIPLVALHSGTNLHFLAAEANLSRAATKPKSGSGKVAIRKNAA